MTAKKPRRKIRIEEIIEEVADKYKSVSLSIGSIIAVYSEFHSLSYWYVGSRGDGLITLIAIDSNYELLANPKILYADLGEINYLLIQNNNSVFKPINVSIPDDYFFEYYKNYSPLIVAKYGDIIRIHSGITANSVYFVMNYDPVTNSHMVKDISGIDMSRTYSINLGFCEYQILSTKELRADILNYSNYFQKRLNDKLYEQLNYLDETIYFKSQMNYLFEKSYLNLMELRPIDFEKDLEINSIKTDLANYDNYVDANNEVYNNNMWKEIFSGIPEESDEKYIEKLHNETCLYTNCCGYKESDDSLTYYINNEFSDKFENTMTSVFYDRGHCVVEDDVVDSKFFCDLDLLSNVASKTYTYNIDDRGVYDSFIIDKTHNNNIELEFDSCEYANSIGEMSDSQATIGYPGDDSDIVEYDNKSFGYSCESVHSSSVEYKHHDYYLNKLIESDSESFDTSVRSVLPTRVVYDSDDELPALQSIIDNYGNTQLMSTDEAVKMVESQMNEEDPDSAEFIEIKEDEIVPYDLKSSGCMIM